MTIEDSVQRWQAYSQMFQKLVDTFCEDIENGNSFSALEHIFLCNLHAILVSAMNISEHALFITQATQQATQKEVETEHE